MDDAPGVDCMLTFGLMPLILVVNQGYKDRLRVEDQFGEVGDAIEVDIFGSVQYVESRSK